MPIDKIMQPRHLRETKCQESSTRVALLIPSFALPCFSRNLIPNSTKNQTKQSQRTKYSGKPQCLSGPPPKVGPCYSGGEGGVYKREVFPESSPQSLLQGSGADKNTNKMKLLVFLSLVAAAAAGTDIPSIIKERIMAVSSSILHMKNDNFSFLNFCFPGLPDQVLLGQGCDPGLQRQG